MGTGDEYSQAAYGTLEHRHARLPITRELAGRWLGHLRRALDASVSAEKTCDHLLSCSGDAAM